LAGEVLRIGFEQSLIFLIVFNVVSNLTMPLPSKPANPVLERRRRDWPALVARPRHKERDGWGAIANWKSAIANNYRAAGGTLPVSIGILIKNVSVFYTTNSVLKQQKSCTKKSEDTFSLTSSFSLWEKV
jgi:hypothetical protein